MGVKRELVAVGLAALLALGGCGGGSGGGGVSSGAPVAQSTSAASADVAAGGAQGSGSVATTSMVQAATTPTHLIEGWLSDGTRKADVNPFKVRAAKDAPTPRHVRLGVLSTAEMAPTKSAPSSGPVPVQIGHGRAIEETADSASVARLLDWKASPNGGKSAALRFQSEGALGLRVGLRIYSLPLGGLVRFRSDGSDEVYEIAAQEIQTLIQRNLDAGDSSEDARTYWSPNLGGDAVTVEFEVPPGTATDTVEVAVPHLSHVFMNAKDAASIQKAAGACNIDINCSPEWNGPTTRAVAQMDYMVGATGYACTGTLLNDTSSSGTPYFLTANHCISSQTVASTLWTDWFYKSSSCGSSTISPSSTQMRSGATLLYSNSLTDTAFLRLNGTPPAGVLYAASAPGGLGSETSVFSVHHPAADWQKYSEGQSTGPATSCRSVDGTRTCSLPNASNYLRVNWTVGTTEGGSSGGGLFKKVGGTPYLVGQLYGGFASCSSPADNEYYGRFDIAYNEALYKWLGGTPVTPPTTPTSPGAHAPIYRFYNTKTGTHFYTISVAERDQVIVKYPQYSYEGIGFYADAGQSASTTPVYRFYNTKTGAHFFTVSAAERDQVRVKYPQYSYEGVAWYVNGAAGGTASPMYRFYNVKTETHFYTINAAERANVLAKYPQFQDEGVAYYAWNSP